MVQNMGIQLVVAQKICDLTFVPLDHVAVDDMLAR
jgi:hypothetical protein